MNDKKVKELSKQIYDLEQLGSNMEDTSEIEEQMAELIKGCSFEEILEMEDILMRLLLNK